MKAPVRSNPKTPGAPRGCAGFTLVELVAVLTVMVIAAAAIAPGLVRFLHGAQLQNAAHRTAALAAEARGLAIARDRTVTLAYDGEAHGMRIMVEPADIEEREMPGADEGAAETPVVGETPTSDNRLIELPPDVRLIATQDPQRGMPGAQPATFLFYGDGRAEGGPVVFERDGFPAISLAANPRTGRVVLREEEQP